MQILRDLPAMFNDTGSGGDITSIIPLIPAMFIPIQPHETHDYP